MFDIVARLMIFHTYYNTNTVTFGNTFNTFEDGPPETILNDAWLHQSFHEGIKLM